jgi:hypothetical protein
MRLAQNIVVYSLALNVIFVFTIPHANAAYIAAVVHSNVQIGSPVYRC